LEFENLLVRLFENGTPSLITKLIVVY